MRGLAAAIALASVGLLGAASGGCNDATHDYEVKALGAEDPNVAKGPLHRPGQPCLVCHGGIGPATSHFSAAGTVYASRNGSAPAMGAAIQIEDIKGSVGTAQSNEAGNFFIPADQWQPTYPALPQVSLGGVTEIMSTHVGRDGSCAACHADPAGPTSAGHVYVNR